MPTIDEKCDAVRWLGEVVPVPASMLSDAVDKVQKGHREHEGKPGAITRHNIVGELQQEVIDCSLGYVAMARLTGVFRWWMIPVFVVPGVIQWLILNALRRSLRGEQVHRA